MSGAAGQDPELSATSPPDAAADVVLEVVASYRWRLGAAMLWARLAYLGAAGALLLLLAVVGDHVLAGGIPRGLRTLALLAWGGGMLAGIGAAVFMAWWRRISPLFAAQYLERACGIRHNAVVNALLLRRDGTSPYLADAAMRQGARALTECSPAGLRRQRSLWPEIMLMGALTAWLVYLVLAPKPLRPSVARFFGADVPAPSATRLELVRPGPDDAVYVGEPLEIEVAVYGRRVTEVGCEITRVGDTWLRPPRVLTSLRPPGDGEDRRQFGLAPFEVRGDVHYRISGGDARLDGVIPVQPQPAEVGVEVELAPPAYTGWSITRAATPDVVALAGTQATFQVLANVDLLNPVFVLRGERETRTRMVGGAGAPRAATVALTLTQGGKYRFEFSDRWGHPGPNPPEHDLEVRPDAPPRVEIVAPVVPADERIDLAQTPQLVASAADDVGLVDVALVIESSVRTQRLPLATIAPPGQAEVVATVACDQIVLGPDEAARAWFEGTDGRVMPDGRPAPQVGRSRVVTLVRAGQNGAGPRPTPESAPSSAAGRKETRATSQPATTRPGESGAGFDGELERFVQQHGEEAREAAASTQPSQRGKGAPPTSRPSPNRPPDSQPSGTPCPKCGSSRCKGGAQCKGGTGAKQGRGGSGGPGSGGSGKQAQRGGAKPGEQPSGQTSPRPGQPGGPGQGANTQGARTVGPGDAGPPPAAEPSPPEPEAGAPLDSTGRAETLDLLEMLDRGVEITEAMLTARGWPPEKAADFVQALARLQAARRAEAAEGAPEVQHDTRVGTADPEAGRTLSGAVERRRDVGPGAVDDLARITPPAEQEVPPDLVAILEAYYRALAARRAAP